MANHYLASSPQVRALRQREDILGVIEAAQIRNSGTEFMITAREFADSYDDISLAELRQHLTSCQTRGLATIEEQDGQYDDEFWFSKFDAKQLARLQKDTAKQLPSSRHAISTVKNLCRTFYGRLQATRGLLETITSIAVAVTFWLAWINRHHLGNFFHRFF